MHRPCPPSIPRWLGTRVALALLIGLGCQSPSGQPLGPDAASQDAPAVDSRIFEPPTDGRVADSGAADSGAADSGAADSGLLDSSPLDSSPLDSSPPDSTPVDAGVADVSSPADAGNLDAPPPVDDDVPVITVGAPDRLLLIGTVITPDAVIEGAVLVEASLITCVDTVAICGARPGAAGATVIDTKAIIAPGMIDTHNHILFDMFDDTDWLPNQLYQDHDQWPNETRYQAMLDVKQCLVNDSQGKPTWCAQTGYGTAAGSLRCEAEKWGELKGLIAGTTSIVGLAGVSSSCFASLVRSVDTAQSGLGQDKVQTSALFPPSSPSTVCANFASDKTDAFVVHVGEGTNARALAEFAKLGTITTPPGCLYAPQTAITHGVAFTATQLTTMAQAGMKLIWSPHSNVSLYGQTADIPAALDAGVTVALGPDWSMGGSQNLLDELRFADGWDNTHWNDRLDAKALVRMATANGAQALALDDRLGKIAVGYLADLAVFTGDRAHPHDAIVAARPRHVRLVLIGGVPLYGDTTLQAAAPAAPGCETVEICGASKFLCVATTSTANKLNQTFAQIKTALGQAMVDADAATPGDGFHFAPLPPIVSCP